MQSHTSSISQATSPLVLTSRSLQQQTNLQRRIIAAILSGAIIISPTDTIYGLTCDATNETAVRKIRRLKQRTTKPLSVWAPSKQWIRCHFIIAPIHLGLLPGPYTLILKLRCPLPANTHSHTSVGCLAPSVLCGLSQAGIRIPDHWFSSVVRKINRPLITTSVNISGKPHAVSRSSISGEIFRQVDIIIDEGSKSGRPSTIIDTISRERIHR